ncbi:Basic proline-rich protein precursor [Luteococcus japonicus LSP_Lj1]|uniref:Basic proline-rich protein n=1 Tax=Luteococcus japonicus LSP_Lj1 TaxID=1255658 RepID=A0A1R4JIN8_9ACTN|nr:Basic proline-rich protein precursor [Luteococcus japonicus LSP_Lj1]
MRHLQHVGPWLPALGDDPLLTRGFHITAQHEPQPAPWRGDVRDRDDRGVILCRVLPLTAGGEHCLCSHPHRLPGDGTRPQQLAGGRPDHGHPMDGQQTLHPGGSRLWRQGWVQQGASHRHGIQQPRQALDVVIVVVGEHQQRHAVHSECPQAAQCRGRIRTDVHDHCLAGGSPQDRGVPLPHITEACRPFPRPAKGLGRPQTGHHEERRSGPAQHPVSQQGRYQEGRHEAQSCQQPEHRRTAGPAPRGRRQGGPSRGNPQDRLHGPAGEPAHPSRHTARQRRDQGSHQSEHRGRAHEGGGDGIGRQADHRDGPADARDHHLRGELGGQRNGHRLAHPGRGPGHRPGPALAPPQDSGRRQGGQRKAQGTSQPRVDHHQEPDSHAQVPQSASPATRQTQPGQRHQPHRPGTQDTGFGSADDDEGRHPEETGGPHPPAACSRPAGGPQQEYQGEGQIRPGDRREVREPRGLETLLHFGVQRGGVPDHQRWQQPGLRGWTVPHGGTQARAQVVDGPSHPPGTTHPLRR